MLSKLFMIAALATGACYADVGYAGTGYYGGPGVTYYGPAQPSLVYADTGVQVIADYPVPIFYSDGFYYNQIGGRWYRSHDYRRGWVETRGGVPNRIARLHDPGRFRNYHGGYRARR